jgi:hypothetical protein
MKKRMIVRMKSKEKKIMERTLTRIVKILKA